MGLELVSLLFPSDSEAKCNNTTLCVWQLNWLHSILNLLTCPHSPCTKIKAHSIWSCMHTPRWCVCGCDDVVHGVRECFLTGSQYLWSAVTFIVAQKTQPVSQLSLKPQMKERCLLCHDWLSQRNNNGSTLQSFVLFFFFSFIFLNCWNEIWIGINWREGVKCPCAITQVLWASRACVAWLNLTAIDGHSETETADKQPGWRRHFWREFNRGHSRRLSLKELEIERNWTPWSRDGAA